MAVGNEESSSCLRFSDYEFGGYYLHKTFKELVETLVELYSK